MEAGTVTWNIHDIWGLACIVHMEAGTVTWNIHDIWGLTCLVHMEAGTVTWNIHDAYVICMFHIKSRTLCNFDFHVIHYVCGSKFH